MKQTGFSLAALVALIGWSSAARAQVIVPSVAWAPAPVTSFFVSPQPSWAAIPTVTSSTSFFAPSFPTTSVAVTPVTTSFFVPPAATTSFFVPAAPVVPTTSFFVPPITTSFFVPPVTTTSFFWAF